VSWQFPGGIPSTSTDTTPQVQYPNAGSYKVTLIATGAGGTDTLIIDKYITMYANPPRPSITQDTNRLISSADTSIQWFVGATPIAGATSKIYNAKADGIYKVEYTDSNGCKSVSATFNFKYTRVGIGIPATVAQLEVFPNPGEGTFYISNSGNLLIRSIQIIDMSGKQVKQIEDDGKTDLSVFDISSEEKGLYVLQATLSDGNRIHLLISKL
jgi:PKD repeat protein